MTRKFKKKKISRNKLLMIFSVMFVGVIGLTVVYAALSTSLNISGSANVTQSSWGLSIEEYSFSDYYEEMAMGNLCDYGFVCNDNYLVMGTTKVEQKPDINGTSITNASLSLSIPGDAGAFLYKVTNNGTIPARLDSINRYTPTYVSKNNNSSDVL